MFISAVILSYYSYLIGISSSHEAALATTMPIIKKQYECIRANDQECIVKSNKLLVEMTHISITTLLNKGVGVEKEFKNELIKYDEWYNKTKNK